MRILFIKPPFNKYSFVQHLLLCEPLEFEILAASVQDNHDVKILDMRLEKRSLITHVETFCPDVIGFTALTMDVNSVNRLAKEIKFFDEEIITCVGGEHASFHPNDFSEDVDFVFQYDGVSTFSQFVHDVESLKNLKKSRAQIANVIPRLQTNPNINDPIDEIPLPNRSLCNHYLPNYVYGAANPVSLIQLSAGCSFRCSYCSIPARQLKFVQRGIDIVLNDISQTKSIDLLSIDANALQNINSAKILYKEIETAQLGKRLMISCRTDTIVRHPEILPILKRAGVSVVAFGIETLNDQKLSDYNKKNSAKNNLLAVKLVHDHEMLVRGNFIIDQDFLVDDFKQLAEDIIRADIEFPSLQILTPLPGTQFYTQKKDQIITTNLDFFDLSHSVLPTQLDVERFHLEFRRLFRKLYGPYRLFRLAKKLPLHITAKALIFAYLGHKKFSYAGHFNR